MALFSLDSRFLGTASRRDRVAARGSSQVSLRLEYFVVLFLVAYVGLCVVVAVVESILVLLLVVIVERLLAGFDSVLSVEILSDRIVFGVPAGWLLTIRC